MLEKEAPPVGAAGGGNDGGDDDYSIDDLLKDLKKDKMRMFKGISLSDVPDDLKERLRRSRHGK